MNYKQNYITKQSEICRKEWFKDHAANKIGGVGIFPDAMLINWQNPKSWNYGCRFIIHRRWLCVVGDIGEATFEWSEDLTLEFLGGIDFGYFLSKCRASPHGKNFEQWDGEIAWQWQQSEVNGKCYEMLHDFLHELSEHSTKEEYDEQARDCYDETGDAEAAGAIASAGLVPSVHAIGMFVGLQMAIAQLKGGA